jgi:hypothetical protein
VILYGDRVIDRSGALVNVQGDSGHQHEVAVVLYFTGYPEAPPMLEPA